MTDFCTFIPCFLLFIINYFYQQMHTHTHTHIHIYIYIYNYITNAPTYFGASAPSSGIFDIVVAEVIKLLNY